jgi:hypothetical protein
MNEHKYDIEKALSGLLKKYSIQEPQNFRMTLQGNSSGLSLLPGWVLFNTSLDENQIPLLTWRLKRKFIELKKIVQDAVVENASMFRFSSMGNKDEWDLVSLLYREMDLCEFIGDGKIVSMQATISNNQAGNVILRLDNNILCSVEISTQMPSGSGLVDRHEIIARRGVASDLVVDTMIPQSSIYSFTDKGEQHYRDVDEELFGFDESQIDHVRSAFQVLKQPELVQQWKAQHNRLVNFINSAIESDKKRKKIRFDRS